MQEMVPHLKMNQCDTTTTTIAHLVSLSWLSFLLCTRRRSQVRFLVKAHARVTGSIPSRGQEAAEQIPLSLMFLSLPLSEISENI